MPSLDHVLRALAQLGKLNNVLLAPTQGRWQASHKVESGGYKIDIQDDPVEALLGALAPPLGVSWDDYLDDDLRELL